MGYLLWVESLAAVLLWVAEGMPQLARKSHPGWRVLFLLPCVIVPLPLVCWFPVVLGRIYILRPDSEWLSTVPWSWLAGLLVGMIGLWFVGLRKRRGQVPAARWPVAKLRVSLAIVVALLVITFGVMDMSMRQHLLAMRSDSLVASLSIGPSRPAPDDNAALDYERAATILGPFDKLPDELSRKWTSLRGKDANAFDPNDVAMRAFLADKAAAIRLLRRGAGKTGCCFSSPRQVRRIHEEMPQYRQFGSGVSLLLLSARIRAADGDRKGAIEDLDAVWTLAGHASSGLTMMDLLVAIGCEGSACQILQTFAEDPNFAPADLAATRTSPDPFYGHQAGLVVRRSAAAYMGAVADFCLTGMIVADERTVTVPGPMLAAYRVLALPDQLPEARRMSKAYLDLADRPYWQCKDDLAKAQAESDHCGFMTSMSFGGIDTLVRAAAEADARRAAAGTAVAACRYRIARGQWPDKLDDLVPAYLIVTPIDPFDGKPLRWKSGGEKIVIYSVGPDGKDDGGAAYDSKAKTGDIIFELRK